MSDPLAPLARRLGWTPSQAWTAVPGLVVAVPVLVASLVGVLGQPAPAPLSQAARPAPVALPTEPDPSAQPPLTTAASAPAAPALGDPQAASPSGFLLPAPPPPFGPVATATAQAATSLPAPSPRPTAAASPRRLFVVAAGWTSTVGDDASVPSGDLPVQAGPGGEVARAFARLAGQGTVLLLAADDTPGAGFGEGLGGGVVACANRSSRWQAGRGQAPAAAPAFDPDRCVTGTLAGGTYAFDLRGLPDITGAGITLLPDPAGPLPYRIALRSTLEEL